ncbi:MAG TPA: N-6 DNA methylase [Candidatus Limnocylindrales bacterium]|nr:N-6 DNA methylase [Candidatus Limnocylindrales bacterium]
MTVSPRANKYCSLNDLTNESSVEQFFVIRLLKDLGFEDSEILTKTSIKELVIGKGSKKENYKPDYAIKLKNKIRLLIDAKDPKENVDNYLYQISGYALAINQSYSTEDKPTRLCVLTNGIITKLYKWSNKTPIVELKFDDFRDGNVKFSELQKALSKEQLIKTERQEKLAETPFDFHPLPIEELDPLFRACHNLIWKKDKLKPTTAFYEFTKLFFVKMDEDKRIHLLNRPPVRSDFRFCLDWIELMENTTDNHNPVDTILFEKLRSDLNKKVDRKEKKRIFPPAERINLKPSTIKQIVKLLEHCNLYGIDEDLNGRMFEAFLSATIRGKELGQFFTPRTVVEFMVDLAELKAGRDHVDHVLDLCCGSGGFLIDAMTDMWKKIRLNPSLSSEEKDDLKNKVVTEYLWGADADKDENLRISRIARMNMVLHGDGSNRIYWLPDSLDKKLVVEKGIPDELREEAEEFKQAVAKGLTFEVALTNPPFSMKYEPSKEDEKEILEDYVLAKQKNTNKLRTLRSNVMFLERYTDFLAPHGKLVTIIDESVLNAHQDIEVREFIKKNFIIKAVISLPRNTFVNADTGVKTSVLYLMKKKTETEQQPAIFMAISENIGHNDAGKKTLELNDLPKIFKEYKRFENGEILPQ